MHNYFVTYKGIGDAHQSRNIVADKVYHSDIAVTFYRTNIPVAAISAESFLCYFIQDEATRA